MQRIDIKKSLAAIILVKQGNKKAYLDIVRLYQRDVYFLCAEILGFTPLLNKVVCDIFFQFYSVIDTVDEKDSFENTLFAFAIRYCSEYVRRNSKMFSFTADVPVVSEDSKLSGDEISQLYHDRKEWEMPNKIAISFFSEMLMNMPVQSKIVFAYLFYTEFDFERISKFENADEDLLKNTAKFGYAYLQYQAIRAKIIHLDFEKYLVYIPFITDFLCSITKTPKGLVAQISERLELNRESNDETNESEEDSFEYPAEEEKKFDVIRFVRILINIAIIIILLGVGMIIRSKLEQKNVALNTQLDISQVQTDSDIWDGKASTSFESGDGTKENPYVISNGSQLAYFSYLINSGDVKAFTSYYVLGDDIVLNDVSDYSSWEKTPPKNNFTPIGYMNSESDYKYFCGTFDGRGYKITGLYCKRNSNAGLFGYVNEGIIKNVNLEKAYIFADKYSAGLVAYFKTSSQNTGVYSCTVDGEINGGSYLGGMVGFCDVKGDKGIFNVSKCTSYAIIKCKAVSAGGIVGYMETNSGKSLVENCLNIGSVTARDNSGGIVGSMEILKGSSQINYCINIGSVKCSNITTGAIAGVCDSFDTDNFATVYACCYLDISATSPASLGDNTKINASSLTAGEFNIAGNFPEFDFVNTWVMDEKLGMPVIK